MATEIERALAVISVEHNLVDPAEALTMIRTARDDGGKSLASQIREGVSEIDLLPAIASELGFEFHDMLARDFSLVVDEEILRRCDHRALTRHAAIPMRDERGRIVVVMANPLHTEIANFFRSSFPEGFAPAIAPRGQVLAQLLSSTQEFEFPATVTTQSVVEWVEYLFERALAEGTSDVHIGYLADGEILIRFRVDGVLRRVPFPTQLAGRESEVVAGLLAKCSTIDPTNLREPQDGKFSLEIAGRPIDFRVNMLPQVTGPKVTTRLLDPQSLQKRLEDMGFSGENLSRMRDAINAPQGCVVVAGPTGSGKTTTLYSLLREVDAITKHCLTAEDPVEYRLDNIGQTQIREDIGEKSLTWAKALRAMVRQDPDVILVGEIRDTQVAKTAMEASITGHLVLTTVHANNAPGVYLRLAEMGVEKFMVSEAISLVISQRLVRRLHDCFTWGPPSAEEKKLISSWGFPAVDRVPKAQGCAGCKGTGYRGRVACVETLVPSMALRSAIGSGTSKETIVQEAFASGWKPIIHDGMRAVNDGATSILEIARTLVSDEEAHAPEEPGAGSTTNTEVTV